MSMADNDIHPDAPAGGGGPGAFRSALPTGAHPDIDQWNRPGPVGANGTGAGSTNPPHAGASDSARLVPDVKPTINGLIAQGGPLSNATIVAVNAAAAKTPVQWRRYIAYTDVVNVGGSLAWRAHNPGNLRDAPTKIATVSGAVGKFAVFASLEDGRAAQRDLYLNRYGDMTVRDAVNKLTPPTENDTKKYLEDLTNAGVDLDKNVKSQIDTLMKAVQANEGLISGTEVKRVP